MRNVLTKRQRERVITRWVTVQMEQDRTRHASAAYVEASAVMQGMSDALEAILIDRKRGADWTEFNHIADEIYGRVEVQRISRASRVTDADLGQLTDTQNWVSEHAS